VGKTCGMSLTGPSDCSDPRTTLVIDVGGRGDFTTLKAAVDWLDSGANMAGPTIIRTAGGGHPIADTVSFNLPYEVVVMGSGFEITTFYPVAGLANKPMFKIDGNKGVDMERCEADPSYAGSLAGWGNAAGEDVAAIMPSASVFIQFQDFGSYGGNKAFNITKDCDVWLFNSVVQGCVSKGVEININGGAAVRFRTAMTDYTNMPVCIDFVKCANLRAMVHGGDFVLSGGQVAVKKAAIASVTYTNLNILSNTWNEVGTFLSGFDFTDANDANVEALTNVGYEDKKPHCNINSLNNLVNQALTAMFSKSIFVNGTPAYACKFTLADNRITLQTQRPKDIWMDVDMTVESASPNRTYDIALVKNGAIAVTSIANNGAGKVRCTCASTKGMVNGDQIYADFAATYADGYYVVSNVAAATFDLAALAFGGNTTASVVMVYGPMSVRIATAAQPYNVGLAAYFDDLRQNDYLEVWMRDTGGATNGRIQDVTWLAVAI